MATGREHQEPAPGAVSVVVPVHGPAVHLGEALRPILAQLEAGDEVVVVDNGTTADLGPHLADPRVRLVAETRRRGAGAARNAGVAAARNESIVFCDSDDVAGEGYVEAMRRALADHAVVAARYAWFGVPESRTDSIKPAILHWSGDPAWPFAGSGCMAIRRSAFLAVGGFDTSIPALEDVDLCCRLTIAGMPIIPVDEAVMHVRQRADDGDEHARQAGFGRASRWLEHRYAEHGLPRERLSRSLPGWLLRSAGLLHPRASERRHSRRILAWKRGRLQGVADVRRGRVPAPTP